MQVASKKAKRYAKIVVLVHMFTLKELDVSHVLVFTCHVHSSFTWSSYPPFPSPI